MSFSSFMHPWMKQARLVIATILAVGTGGALADRPLGAAAGQDPGERDPARYRIGVHFWKTGSIYDEALQGIHDGLHLAGIEHAVEVVNSDRNKALARENLRRMDAQGFDLIYSLSSAGTRIAADLHMTTPVIATVINHPRALGVNEDAREHSAVLTGTSYYVDAGKQLDLYRRLFSGLKTLGMIFDRENPAGALAEEPFMREACEQAGIKFLSIAVTDVEELGPATRELLENGVDAIAIPTNKLVYDNLSQVLAITNGNAIPVVSMSKQGVENGALAGLFADTYNLGRQTASIARQILENGANVEYPFEYVDKPDVILNLSGAQAIGYAFPPEVLGSASIVMQ